MGEILKKIQSSGEPELGHDLADEVDPRLRIHLSHVDFVSTRGVFRAYEDAPGQLEIAPNNSEVWGDYNRELGRRATQTLIRTNRMLDEAMA